MSGRDSAQDTEDDMPEENISLMCGCTFGPGEPIVHRCKTLATEGVAKEICWHCDGTHGAMGCLYPDLKKRLEDIRSDAEQVVLRDAYAIPQDVYILTRRIFVKLSEILKDA